MQGVIATCGQIAIHGDEFLHTGNLARQNDLIALHAEFFGTLRRIQRRAD